MGVAGDAPVVATVTVDDTLCEVVVCLDDGVIHRVSVTPGFHTSVVTTAGRRGLCGRLATILLSGALHIVGDGGDGALVPWPPSATESGDVVDGMTLLPGWGPVHDVAVQRRDNIDTMLACCGYGATSTVREVRAGLGVDQLLRTPPIFGSIRGVWVVVVSGAHRRFVVVTADGATYVFASEIGPSEVVELEKDAGELSGFDMAAETVHTCCLGTVRPPLVPPTINATCFFHTSRVSSVYSCVFS